MVAYAEGASKEHVMCFVLSRGLYQSEAGTFINSSYFENAYGAVPTYIGIKLLDRGTSFYIGIYHLTSIYTRGIP